MVLGSCPNRMATRYLIRLPSWGYQPAIPRASTTCPIALSRSTSTPGDGSGTARPVAASVASEVAAGCDEQAVARNIKETRLSSFLASMQASIPGLVYRIPEISLSDRLTSVISVKNGG